MRDKPCWRDVRKSCPHPRLSKFCKNNRWKCKSILDQPILANTLIPYMVVKSNGGD